MNIFIKRDPNLLNLIILQLFIKRYEYKNFVQHKFSRGILDRRTSSLLIIEILKYNFII